MNEMLRRVFIRAHCPIEVALTCVSWYITYPLSSRQLQELMTERGTSVDRSTILRWAIKLLPMLAAVCRHRKRPVGKRWRMDETYIKVAGQRKYLYRAVDRSGATVDFLLRAKRDYAEVRAIIERAIKLHDLPGKVSNDKSGYNKAAIFSVQGDTGLAIPMRHSKYLNNIVELDFHQIKRITRPMLSFKNFRCAQIINAGFETMHMICKGQLADTKDEAAAAATHFNTLAFRSPHLSAIPLAPSSYCDRTIFCR